MIKRKINYQPPAEQPQIYTHLTISITELLYQTETFLEENYKGLYIMEYNNHRFKNVNISVTGFAEIVKIIVKKTFGNDLVYIDGDADLKALKITVKFNTGALLDDDFEKINEIASKSGFTSSFKRGELCLTAPICGGAYLTVNAGNTNIVYKALRSCFES